MITGTTQAVDPQTFKVDLGDVASSVAQVHSWGTSIGDEYIKIKLSFELLSVFGEGMPQSAWSSPAGVAFAAVETQLVTAMSVLQELLDEIVSRMGQTYDNYVQAETVNTQILTL